MDLSWIIGFATFIVTLILGAIAKKHPAINNKLIPLQNLFIGIIACLIYYFVSKDFQAALVVTGLAAGGAYDFWKNMTKLLVAEEPKYDDFNDMEG